MRPIILPLLFAGLALLPAIGHAQTQAYRPDAPPPNHSISGTIGGSLLEAHNAVRTRVGVAPLVWSPQLAAAAQDWANHLLTTGAFAHRPSNRYGENLYTISGGAASPTQVVASWANEARGYDLHGNTCYGVCGHYTQIVWRATRAVGCAVASNGHREVWVCEYDPPGNVIGYRPY